MSNENHKNFKNFTFNDDEGGERGRLSMKVEKLQKSLEVFCIFLCYYFTHLITTNSVMRNLTRGSAVSAYDADRLGFLLSSTYARGGLSH